MRNLWREFCCKSLLNQFETQNIKNIGKEDEEYYLSVAVGHTKLKSIQLKKKKTLGKRTNSYNSIQKQQ